MKNLILIAFLITSFSLSFNSCKEKEEEGEEKTEICDNGIDDDGDGFTDCDDLDCENSTSCKETECSDGVDNDGDGFTDCDDFDCEEDAACKETDCTDNIDNDGDGFTDCDDPDCANDPNC